VDGYLVEPRNVEKMALCAESILADESIRKEMGKRAREKAHAHFCSNTIITQYENYYQRLLG
jgi:glycosyltransferase involved in cell wall biosynthesis